MAKRTSSPSPREGCEGVRRWPAGGMAYRQNVPQAGGGGSGALSMPGRQVAAALPPRLPLCISCPCAVSACARRLSARGHRPSLLPAPGAAAGGAGPAADASGGRVDASIWQGKMGTISNAQDLSEMLEVCCAPPPRAGREWPSALQHAQPVQPRGCRRWACVCVPVPCARGARYKKTPRSECAETNHRELGRRSSSRTCPKFPS
jgi:hypothetical protein